MESFRKCSQCGADLPPDSSGQQCPQCLTKPKPEAAGPARTIRIGPLPEIPASEKAGDWIGRYQLLEQIGEGGMGTVWLAEQVEPLRRKVALKVVKLGMDTKQIVARFELERQALALMQHPNIAQVLDAGATDTGRPFFVMELVRGVRITDYCDRKHLSTAERLNLFIKVCQAIQHAHQKGIIHRDIKPSNILVTETNGEAVPKVIDFGIAKAVTEKKLTNQTLMTGLGQFLGTPAYMSPEQAGANADIDTRSDIYSLGVMLYEMLTGRPPFEVKELLAAGLEAMRRVILEQEPVKPSTRLRAMIPEELTTTANRRSADSPKLVRQIRGDLDWIVMKCLEKDRTRRYETADALAEDLGHHLSNEPVDAAAPDTWYRVSKFVRRNKAAFAVALLIGVVLVAATGFSAWQAIRATRAQALAEERLAESDATAKFLLEVFQSPDLALTGMSIRVADALGAAVVKLDTELPGQPRLRAKLRAAFARTYNSLGETGWAISLQEQARDYYVATGGLENPDALNAISDLANSYDRAGRHAEALKLMEQVLPLRRKVSGPEDPDTLWAMNCLAVHYDQAGRKPEAIKLWEATLPLRQKVSGPGHPATLLVMENLANACDEIGRHPEALTLREQILAACRKMIDPKQVELLRQLGVMNYQANGYEDRGDMRAAWDMRVKARKLRRQLNRPDQQNNLEELYTAMAMDKLAFSYEEAGLREATVKLREEALQLWRAQLGPDTPNTIHAMEALAVAYEQAGRYDDALNVRQQVLAVSRKVFGSQNPQTLQSLNDLAWMLATSKAAKIRNGTYALPCAEEAVAATHRTNAMFLDTLAAADAETLQFDKAVTVQQEAIRRLHDGQEIGEFTSRLRLYQAGKPYRE